MRTELWSIDRENHLIMRFGQEYVIPVLEFAKIGQGGDFTSPVTYKLTVEDRMSWCARGISRNCVPGAVRKLYRKFLFSGMPELQDVPNVLVLLPEELLSERQKHFSTSKRLRDGERFQEIERLYARVVSGKIYFGAGAQLRAVKNSPSGYKGRGKKKE